MSAADYERGLIIQAQADEAKAREQRQRESDAALAAAETKRKGLAGEYYAGAEKIANQRSNLSGMLDQITKASTDAGIQANDEQFGAARGRLLKEQAALGRLTQPAAQYNIRSLEGSNQKNIGDLIKSIYNTGLQQKYNAGNQTISDLLNAFTASQNYGMTGSMTGLNEFQNLRGINQTAEEAAIEQALAPYLGRIQAEANEPGTLDYLNTAFQGLGALGQVAGGVGGVIGGINSGKKKG